MAAPHVTGAVAIVASNALQNNTPLTPTDIASILKRSATDLGSSGVDSVYGWGLLNVPAALSPIGDPEVPTDDTVDNTTPTRGNGRGKKRFSSRGLFDDSFLNGMIVLDDFGRPFEVESLGDETVGASQPGAHIGALASVVLSQPIAETKTESYQTLAWNSEASSLQPSQSYHFVSEEFEMRVSYGMPKVSFALAQSMGSDMAQPQSLDQMMYSALNGNTERIFDRAASVYARRPISSDWDFSSFLVYSLNHIAYVPGIDAPIPYDWDNSRASFAGMGFNRHLGDVWSIGLTYTALHEIGTVGGIDYQGAFAFGESALTQTAGLTLAAKISDHLSLGGFYSLGLVKGIGSSDSMFEKANWQGNQYGVALSARDLAKEGDNLHFSLTKAFAATQGTINARVPIGRELDGGINYDLRTLALNASQLPVNLEVRYSIPFGAMRATLALDMTDENISASGLTRYGIMSGFTYAF